MSRKNPSAKCDRCGRTVALTAQAAAAVKAIGYDASIVNNKCLRPHKCQHGNYCDECPETHA